MPFNSGLRARVAQREADRRWSSVIRPVFIALGAITILLLLSFLLHPELSGGP